jgi:hypothetical protein
LSQNSKSHFDRAEKVTKQKCGYTGVVIESMGRDLGEKLLQNLFDSFD